MRSSLLLVALALASAGPLRAQSEEKAILAVVKNVFDGMRTRDTALMRAQFAPGARMVGVSTKEGKTSVDSMDPALWIGSVGKSTGGPTLDERIFEPTVEVDAEIAHVWTYYEFWLGPKLSHCGYDSFFLVKLADGWKISQVADTRRKDCKARS